MRRMFLIVGFLALAMGLLWIGQGTGIGLAAIELHDQPNSVGRLWRRAGGLGLVLIWQSQRWTGGVLPPLERIATMTPRNYST